MHAAHVFLVMFFVTMPGKPSPIDTFKSREECEHYRRIYDNLYPTNGSTFTACMENPAWEKLLKPGVQ
jgi:hypothetical protein